MPEAARWRGALASALLLSRRLDHLAATRSAASAHEALAGVIAAALAWLAAEAAAGAARATSGRPARRWCERWPAKPRPAIASQIGHYAVVTSTFPASSDPLRQREAQAYGRFRRRLEAADALLGLALALIGALAGAWLADTLDTPGPLIVDVAVWLAVVGGAAELAGLPLSVVAYRRSRREGLSRQRPGPWLLDRAKGLVLGFVVGVPAVTALLALQRQLPQGWWFPAALGASGLELVMATIGPVLILPLFLRSRPLDPGPLADDLVDLARRADVRVASMRVLEAGAKTSAGNAFVSGLGPTRRIMIFDTLIGEDGEPDAERIREMRAVLAHELGHARALDLWRGLALGAASALVAFAFANWLLGVLRPRSSTPARGACPPFRRSPWRWASPSCHWESWPRPTPAAASAPPTPSACARPATARRSPGRSSACAPRTCPSCARRRSTWPCA